MKTFDEWKKDLYSKGPVSKTDAELSRLYQTYTRKYKKSK